MSKKEDDEEDERLWNLIVWKFYGTNKEMEEAWPAMGIIFVVIIIAAILFALFS